MIGFQFYAAGTFQFLIILVQGSILFAEGANRSEHFARRLTLDLLGLFLISLPLTLGYWRMIRLPGALCSATWPLWCFISRCIC